MEALGCAEKKAKEKDEKKKEKIEEKQKERSKHKKFKQDQLAGIPKPGQANDLLREEALHEKATQFASEQRSGKRKRDTDPLKGSQIANQMANFMSTVSVPHLDSKVHEVQDSLATAEDRKSQVMEWDPARETDPFRLMDGIKQAEVRKKRLESDIVVAKERLAILLASLQQGYKDLLDPEPSYSHPRSPITTHLRTPSPSKAYSTRPLNPSPYVSTCSALTRAKIHSGDLGVKEEIQFRAVSRPLREQIDLTEDPIEITEVDEEEQERKREEELSETLAAVDGVSEFDD